MEYKKIARTCVVCGKAFEGTSRAKYCCRAHNVAATLARAGKPTIWQRVRLLEEENERLRQGADQEVIMDDFKTLIRLINNRTAVPQEIITNGKLLRVILKKYSHLLHE